MSTIITLRAKVRIDVKDPDSDRWSDAELDQHITHAVQDINQAVPVQAKDEALTIPDPAKRVIDISGLTGLIRVRKAEYPTGEYPPRYRHFNHWGDELMLMVTNLPTAGDSIHVLYDKEHTVDADGSTLPGQLEELCVMGAAAYAAIQRAAYTINKVNIGGEPTPEDYSTWGKSRLREFHAELRRLRRKRVRTGTMYTEDTT